ncbi:Hint domain-containing protein [Oceanicola sp. 502str15]|uniref:Hint domain-containing protein n=1 Tax=Oceanicola sp. 502str15 TaxID=2696061 RepID=UPI0020943871|nr:Hint domain-containing protein [Oceanicola sp. 502str15]MCO6383397.1 hemolysin-type calcium-binding protein [Oceanicola sp. 502str15]
MKTGFLGTFVIPWSHTETDGHPGAAVESLHPGATWRWSGALTRVDGPGDVISLAGAEGVADLHRRAARKVRRMISGNGAALAELSRGEDARRAMARAEAIAQVAADSSLLPQAGFTVTDGQSAWMVSWIETLPGASGLLMFAGGVPPEGTDLRVSDVAELAETLPPPGETAAGGVICFTAGTRIATPEGFKLVETLREGDLVQTKDDGAQPVLWAGQRRMTGARLFAMPQLRPMRIRAGVLGPDIPDGDLLVSPNHRMLIRGPAARALFNTPEVLVRARDLAGMRGIATDTRLTEATYVHILMDRHQVLFANGVETESFHPAEADFATLDAGDRARLLDGMPWLKKRPDDYGAPARRTLSDGEAAILRHDAALAA